MTISNPDNIITFNGDGVTTAFPFPIYFLADSHVVVTKIKISDQSRITQIEGLDYSLTGEGDQAGGTVTTTAPVTTAFLLEIQRIVPIIQTDNYHANDVFPAETFEKDLDYGIMVSQQLDRRIGAIEATGAGGGITLANLAGPGVGIYYGQVGQVHSFKKLVGAGGVTIVDAGTEVQLSLGGALLIVNNLTDVANRQASLNNLTAAAGGGNEYVLTRDTATGNAVWKVAPTGSGGSGGALLIVNNLSDVASQQLSLNNVTAVAAATNEYVLTKDTATGNAKWKVSAAAGALLIANNLTDVASQQTALNNLTAVAPATNEYVLTKDTATGSAKWKAAVGGGALPGGGSSAQFLRGDSVWSNIITAKSLRVEYGGTPSEFVLKNTAGAVDNKVWKIWADHGLKTLQISAFDDGETNAGTGIVIARNGINLTSIQLQASRTILANGSDDGVSALQVAGDFHILGTGRRIKGEFSTATLTNRVAFQSDVVNGVSSLTVIPNGTATTANLTTINNSDLTAPASYTKFQISNSLALLESGAINAGTILPLALAISGAVKLRITPAGLVTINEPTDDGTSALQVNGDLHVVGLARRFLANFSDATPANRMIFQTDVVNGITAVTFMPNGTGNLTAISFYNNGNALAALSYADVRISNTVAQITSNQINGGTVLPLVFSIGGTIRARMTASGLLTLGEPTDDGTSRLQVNGAAYINASLSLQNSDLWNARTVVFTGEVDDGVSGTAKTIAFTGGQYHKVSMTGNCTFTFTPPAGPAVVHLKLTQDGTGSRVMTLPAGKWPGNYAAADKLLSTAINAVDLLTAKWDGAAWFYTLSKAWA